MLTQIRTEAAFTGFLTLKAVVTDDHPHFALPPAQALHCPGGRTAGLLIIQPDITGAAVYRQIGQQREHLHALASGFFNRIADHRIIQRQHPDNIHALA
ncbi:hypothetical protein D3C76_1614190 [compost metagenome]